MKHPDGAIVPSLLTGYRKMMQDKAGKLKKASKIDYDKRFKYLEDWWGVRMMNITPAMWRDRYYEIRDAAREDQAKAVLRVASTV